jgi:gliding motility-associated-like protein
MRFVRFVLLLILTIASKVSLAQDVDLYLTEHYLAGKSVIKLSRDFDDPYMWILTKNNEIYRLHTGTKQLDDFTAQFKSITGGNIFDIAGISAAWVVVAVRNGTSVDLVSDNVGSISYPLQGTPYSFKGTIKSIGTSSLYTEFAYGVNGMPAVLIATNEGFYRLSLMSHVLNFNSTGASQIYSATYRTQLFENHDEVDTSGYNVIPVMGTTPGPWFYPGVLRTGASYGGDVTTAYFAINQTYDFTTPVFLAPDVFWGNNTGLYQAKLRNYSPFLSPYKHYLDNIKINKITDIYGLTALGHNGARENLLVGTDKGLYYSSSFLHVGPDPALDNYSLYHFDPLGNVPINFVEVNNANKLSYPPPFCENGIWCATNDGIYLIRPDYTAHFNRGQLISAIHFKDQDATVNQTSICESSTATIQLNSDVTTATVQWFKDSKEIVNENGTSLTVNAGGDYYAILFDPCAGVSVQSNHLKVQVISSPVFSFNYPDKLPLCNSASIILKTDNNSQYTYRWYTDGVLNGGKDYQYTVSQSGKYKVEVSACNNSWVSSKEIEVDLINLPVPVVTADKTNYCAGDQAILTANTPTDPSYTISWYKDGTLLSANQDKTSLPVTENGNYTITLSSTLASCTQTSAAQAVTFTTAPVFTFNYPDELRYCSGTPTKLKTEGDPSYQYRWYKDGTLTGDVNPSISITQTGKYKVEVSSCNGSWVPSKEVQVDMINLPMPAIVTDRPAYCIGDNAIMSINAPTHPSYTINWYKDNSLLTAYTNKTKIITTDGGNYSVSIVNNLPNIDGTTCMQTSAVQSVLFNPPPTASIQKIVRTTLCDGQTVDLKVSYDAGAINWSTGQNTDQISVKQSGTYKATITSPGGCSTEVNSDVQFFPNPTLNIANTAVCVPSHKSVTLTAPIGMTTYTWNGQQGNNTYVVDHPQRVTLTVTDANGCQATQDIQVADECPDIRIPNAFTPNGDGVNDTWDIVGLEYDQTALVKVFTRYGQQVYQSKGYGSPWNGEYQGKKLPMGAYYYIINTKHGTQTLSGELTIIY